jgi:hypothetical protein
VRGLKLFESVCATIQPVVINQEVCMKSSIGMVLAVSGALAFALGAEAQAPKEHSMTGCLKKGTEANTYTLDLETKEGKGPKTLGVVSSTADLAPHVGHRIEVTGTAVPATEAETDKKIPKAEHYMRLTAIKMISATCP